MKLTVTDDDGSVIFEVLIPDGRHPLVTREHEEWRARMEQTARFQANPAVHPIRPVDTDVVPTSPPAPQGPGGLYGQARQVPVPLNRPGQTTFAWNPAVTEILPAVVPCPDDCHEDGAEYHCAELGPHVHYADGGVRSKKN